MRPKVCQKLVCLEHRKDLIKTTRWTSTFVKSIGTDDETCRFKFKSQTKRQNCYVGVELSKLDITGEYYREVLEQEENVAQ